MGAEILALLRAGTPVLFLGIAIAAGLTLWLPHSAAQALGITAWRIDNHAAIGGALIVSASIVLAHLLWGMRHPAAWIFAWLKQRREAARLRSARLRYLADLTPEEKDYLLPYIKEQANTQQFQIEDGIAMGLARKGIIYQASQLGSFDEEGFAFNLQPWARAHLTAHPGLLDGAARHKREGRRERI